MNLIQSILLGIVEGVTEFIPVSSTFHLLASAQLLGVRESDFFKLFTVVIQSGAILSIVFLYAKELKNNSFLRKLLVASFIPTAIVGAIFYPVIKGYFFENTLLQLSVFVGVGLLFIGIEKYIASGGLKLDRSLSDVTIRHAITIGIMQSTSIIPGVSRSGSVLLSMLALGYNRRDAASYAFMLSLPTIFAATALDLYQGRDLIMQSAGSNLFLLTVGTVVAFFSALWVMKWLIRYLSSHSLVIFGYYRLVAAVVLYYLL